MTVEQLLSRWPFAAQFLVEKGISTADQPEATVGELLPGDLRAGLESFIASMEEFLGTSEEAVHTITISGGRGKDGSPEPVTELTIGMGEVICLVGPTGSGKSRLLEDIEWVARGDTPTGRHIAINGEQPEDKWRTSSEHKLVAQLSQNMNFVMDLSVQEFLALHAESRQVAEPAAKVTKIWQWANELTGEPFSLDTPVTILVGQEKIVLMATHDPILALMGDRRVVLGGGAMRQVIEPTERERANLTELRTIDARLMALRHRLRSGERLDEI
jgi:ABC-type lipoprotein export system ATPase subunit